MADESSTKSLNLKHPDVHRLARELADATGESMTAAVVRSVQERLDRVRAERGAEVEARIERIMELAAVIREHAPPGYFDQDFDALLYDDAGLPR
jgi:antitoxin VapB